MEPIREFQGEFRWLSNFWPAEVILDGEKYPSVEHAYQAAKTDSPGQRKAIREEPSPSRAKQMGKLVTIKPSWDMIKLDVMRYLVEQKFTRHRDLRAKLQATGDREIQEGNMWNDTFWGISLKTGKGENHLGRIIMDIRAGL